MTESTPQLEILRRSLSLESLRTWLLLIATVVLLGVIYMGQASQAAITGQRIHDKQERLVRTERENAQLQADIAALLTPSRLEARARLLGLHLPNLDQIKTVVVNDYPPETASPALVERSKPAPATAGLLDLAAWWNNLLSRLGMSVGSRAAEATTNP